MLGDGTAPGDWTVLPVHQDGDGGWDNAGGGTEPDDGGDPSR